MIVQPSSSSSRWMVDAAGGAPAVKTRTPFGARRRRASGAFANEIKTVGAAHSIVIRSFAINSKTARDSTLRRQMWVAPAAVTVQTKVQPLALKNGSVHR